MQIFNSLPIKLFNTVMEENTHKTWTGCDKFIVCLTMSQLNISYLEIYIYYIDNKDYIYFLLYPHYNNR